MRLSRVSILLCVLAYPASRLMFPLMSSTIKCYFNQAQKYWVKKSSQNFDLSTIWSTYVDRNFEIFHFISMNWFFAQYLKQQCSKCYTWSLHICLLISLIWVRWWILYALMRGANIEDFLFTFQGLEKEKECVVAPGGRRRVFSFLFSLFPVP